MDQFKEALRSLLAAKGKPVKFDGVEVWSSEEGFIDSVGSIYSDKDMAEAKQIAAEGHAAGHNVEWRVSTYGWVDADALFHALSTDHAGGKGCSWIVPEGVTLTEESYSQFEGTDADNSYKTGVNVSGAECACGQYRDVTLRYEAGTLGEILKDLFAADGLTL